MQQLCFWSLLWLTFMAWKFWIGNVNISMALEGRYGKDKVGMCLFAVPNNQNQAKSKYNRHARTLEGKQELAISHKWLLVVLLS